MRVLTLSFLVVLSDQFTKHLAQDRLDRFQGVVIVPGLFDFRYVQNTGAAWGIMQGLSFWLVLLSIGMLVLLIGFRRYFIPATRLAHLAGGLIIGGIVGNLIDRLRLGYVVDFIHLHWRGQAFPTFNIADSAICIGVGLFMIEHWRLEHHRSSEGAAPPVAPAPPPADVSRP